MVFGLSYKAKTSEDMGGLVHLLVLHGQSMDRVRNALNCLLSSQIPLPLSTTLSLQESWYHDNISVASEPDTHVLMFILTKPVAIQEL